ncbi:MAG TPA: hypothetical protein VEZ90_15820 [Blastocatellia bacterium]|nr:hypothetical protein [Blastocatellia bacterium]
MNIVLAHGYLGFARLLGVEYFNRVKAHIEAAFPSVKVLVTQVDPADGIDVRGSQLRGQILDSLGVTGNAPTLNAGDKTHIIAHSMGGLDSRYILSPANPNNIAVQITSLTTISTPHRGSPIADLLWREASGEVLSEIEKLTALGLHKSMSLLGIPLEGLQNLTSDSTAQFNRKYVDNPNVRYFSVAGKGRNGFLPTCLALLAPHLVIKHEVPGEENDGLVAVGSAAWGTMDRNLWPADHADEIGHNLDKLPVGKPDHFDYLSAYDAIVGKLLPL